MSQELLKAWVHNVLQNPIDDHQLAHAEATKELLEENARYREVLEKIESFTMSQFMGIHDMALECKIVARQALKGE